MVAFPKGWDPQAPGSRYTSRASLAILSRKDGASPYRPGEDSGDADELIVEVFEPDVLTDDGPLGQARAVNGLYGRGAAGWAAIIEWALTDAVSGIIGAAAWEAVRRGGALLRQRIEAAQQDQVRVLVSRGAAALLAIDHVLRQGVETDVLDVEAVEEPSMVGGGTPLEMHFVGAEPWLVLLVNAARSRRYLVAVAANGTVAGMLPLTIDEMDSVYLRLQPRNDH